ncbi:hypothetical protein [Zobellia uliginosa]|uniref:hypothetical protein n=1 Tax=Zobellia uliginosa TaxID=143224 RepID=UPI001C07DFF9|nr:hypothetical protein [Zobellia uliginosa]MBU2947952.1 hypothetical protein [Zobellia uliginosa]
MTTEEFVKAFYCEKQDFLKEYLSDNTQTEAGELIKKLKLTANQTEIMGKVLDSAFTDIFYTILLGLDGAASIGGHQEIYELKDENGNKFSGEIEGFAYEYFHESN